MNAAVVLDQPGSVTYTNLDLISGRIVVRNPKPADVNQIVVKLEGESRTRLMSPAGPNGERPKAQVEYHKILYRTQVVFPPLGVFEGRSPASGRATYTLPFGQHEYPFSFKLPFNNSCSIAPPTMPIIVGMEVARPATRHVKRTLPPTLSGFPGEAEIRYFVKVTVNRHSLFKENPRAYQPFNFFPIEPPRAPLSGTEIFARQKHHFDSFPDSGMTKDKMKGMFGKKSSVAGSPTAAGGPASISVDARLPEPAVLTCNQDVPLRLIFKRLTEFQDQVYMQSLQVSLIEFTKIRAHEIFRTESNSWIIVSKSNMGVPLGTPSDPANHETIINDHLWRNQAIPTIIAPTFITCNIERWYQLDVRIGLSCINGNNKPQQVVLPLRLDTLVYSGIAPPPEVLTRMAEAKANANTQQKSSSQALDAKLRAERHDSEFGANQIPLSPIDATGPSAWPPPQVGESSSSSAAAPQYDDAPPSYEDAIAAGAAPVSGPRPTYAPPPPVEHDHVLRGDEKRDWAD